MRPLLLSFALVAAQAISMQQKPVVHLKANTAAIEAFWGGSILELRQAPAVVYLPPKPPKPDAGGNRWTLDVKNFGPLPVTVEDKHGFSTPVTVNQTIHIVSNGSAYSLKH
jgi:hypothetical protein